MALIEISDERSRAEAATLAQRLAKATLVEDDRAALVDTCRVRERLASGPGSGLLRIKLGTELGRLAAVGERPDPSWGTLVAD